MKRITSTAELKEEALSKNGGYVDFFITLNFGLKSSKRILYDSGENLFSIVNEIDCSYQDHLTEEELWNETHIALAIDQGALFKY